ncbi:MAG: chorismate synthase [Phycisphaerae bacterium]|nr:chorismate synthase [Phycisphaerae bacterium]
MDSELRRRQGGYGRGARQRIETDTAVLLSGVRLGRTMGSPVLLQVANRDSRMDDVERTPPITRPRPGHADLAGSLKWLTPDCRTTLERASARETAGRVAAGALARMLLRAFGIEVMGFVRGSLDAVSDLAVTPDNWQRVRAARDASELYCPCPDTSAALIERIHRAKVDQDTVGGLIEVHVFGCPPGMGTCAQWPDRLDSRLAGAVMGIQAFKAVEIGLGRECAFRTGSAVHDPIVYDAARAHESHLGFTRTSNNAGGVEGGMTNGMPIVVRGTMKPIATLLRGLPSVDLVTHDAHTSQYERSDISAIAAASVVMEHVVAFEVASAFLAKFGGDSMAEVRAHFEASMRLMRALPDSPGAVDAARHAATADEALAAIVRAMHADSGTLHFADASRTLMLAASAGALPPPLVEKIRVIAWGKGMAGACAERNEPVSMCNLVQDTSGVVRPGAKSSGMEGAIVVPVRGADGAVIGTLGVANAGERTFTSEEIACLNAAAAELRRFAPANSEKA